MIADLKPYPTMKESGIEWLGDVPEHWEVRRLGTSVHGCINGTWGNDPNGREDLLCVRVADFDRVSLRVRLEKPTLRAIAPGERNRRLLKKGDLLLEKSGGGDLQPVGVVMLYDHDAEAVCSNFIARMSVSARCDPSYLTYLHSHLYAIRLNVRSIKQTTGIQNLNSSSYLGEPVTFPPLSEQAAIVRYLDHVDRRIRRYIHAKQKLVKLLEEQKQALIHQSVTSGLDPNVRLKPSGVEWLGDVPEHWEVVALRYVATKFGSGVTPRGGATMYEVTGIPFLRSQNIHFDGIHLEGVVRIPQDLHDTLAGTHVKPGDVLLNITGASIGRVCSVPDNFEEGNVNQHVCIIRPKRRRVLPGFLAAFLSTPFMQREIRFEQNGASREGLTLHSIRGFKVALPTAAEQQHILDEIRGQTGQLAVATATAQGEVDLLREYRTRLIADVVTGKLDVREAAASLLEEADERDPLDEVVPLADDVVDNLYHRVGRGAGNGK